MIYAQLLSSWLGNGTADTKRPRFFDDYKSVTANDITGQVVAPPPNVVVIEIFTDAQSFAIIESDANYEILISEERPDETT